jgi:molecular chaperone GrpE
VQGTKGDEEATMNVARQMLNVLDNFDRAFKIMEAETDDEKALEAAYQETYAKILSIFKELGVTEIEALGKEFDYEFHQAVLQRPHEDYEEGFVCEELQKGYVLNGSRLVRAVMVSVAA